MVPLASRATTLTLLAVALLGFAHIAFLPPFEGFDETAHLSYIQQVADTGTFPRLGRDMLSTDVEEYPGPLPYGRAANEDRTYWAFFSEPAPTLDFPPSRMYRAGEIPNWQAQHPPLYYLLMTPFYKLARDWSWPSLFLLLRSVSWALAFAGFAIGALATLRAVGTLSPASVWPTSPWVVTAWPFLFPEFFPEMARLGNDSLCLLLMGLAWMLLLRLFERRDVNTAAMLGLALGLGLWTKAFFIAIAAGIGAFLVFAALRGRSRELMQSAGFVLIVAAVIGSGWYVSGWASTGSLDFLQADKAPDVLGDTLRGFDLGTFLHGLGGIAVSFAWAGTWSFGRFDPIYTAPVVLLVALPLMIWMMQLRRARDVTVAPLFIAAPMVLGLVAHWVTQMTLPGHGNATAGWYLHILAGPLALALALGWRKSFWPLAAYAGIFHAACWALQLSLFSGCAFKSPDYKYVQAGECLIVPEHLALLAWPTLGTAALLLAFLSAGAYFYRPRTSPRPPP